MRIPTDRPIRLAQRAAVIGAAVAIAMPVAGATASADAGPPAPSASSGFQPPAGESVSGGELIIELT